jgi:tripartite ATP-independent transporter DctM subunit
LDFDWNLLFVALMFGTFVALLFTGYPVAFVLGGVGVLFAFAGEAINAFGGDVDADLATLGLVVDRIYGTMSSYGLVPLPLFIFMGHMLDRSGIAADLLKAMQTALGRIAGGLAIAVTLLGVVLAASTGIIGASVALLGTLALPAMLADRYQPELAVGTVAAAGCLGILIPPSIMLVLMADQMLLSVGDLFMAAVLPGLVLAGLYLAYLVVLCRLRPDLAPPVSAPAPGGSGRIAEWGSVLRGLVPPLLLIVAVLGSIFFGIVSPSEAAGVGAAGATLLAALRGRLGLSTLREASEATARTTSFIFAIFLGATCFAVILRGLGGDEVVEAGVTALPFGASGVVLVLMALVFALGFFLDWIEITLIVLPLVEPITGPLGIDKLWFTMLVAVCLQTSFLTPPVGFALFYLKGVAPPSVELGHLYRGIVPFVVLQLVGLALLFCFPALATWLPGVAY